jgi:two-component system sensor histidine kinase KdpD
MTGDAQPPVVLVPPTTPVPQAGTGGPRRRLQRYGRRAVRLSRRYTPDLLAVVAALAFGSIVVGALEQVVGFDNGSPAFLLAVVAVAVARGTGPAIATAVGSFLVYDFLFIEPLYTFTVRDPAEWLNLLLLLVIGTVVGRLAGRERERAIAAIEGEREALAMFNISFTLAGERDPAVASRPIAEILRSQMRASRVWIKVAEAVTADTADAASPPIAPPVQVVLRRRPGDEPAEWVRVHTPGPAGKAPSRDRSEATYRVAIAADGDALGAVWVDRPRDLGDPDEGETRVIAAAADQIGGAIQRARLQRDAMTAEVSRRSDALKSALLDSVSHDLRTPLASIRAAAGTLMDPEVEWPAERRREIAASIDREADWLNRLVTNLLDMSRVDAGELRPSLAVFSLADLVGEAVARSGLRSGDREVTVRVPMDLPPVLVDEVLMGQVLANTLDNAVKYAGPGAPIRVMATRGDPGFVRVTVEDGGVGVPPDALPRLFEKFYRVPRKGEGSRRGTGIGLAVVRGIVEAMGGRAMATKSSLGGLAIEFDLPVASPAGIGGPAT